MKRKKKNISFVYIIKLVIIALILICCFLYIDHLNAKKIIDNFAELLSLVYLNLLAWLNDVKYNVEFNNREYAIGVLLLFFIILALTNKNVRKDIPNLIKTAFHQKLVCWYISMILYFIGVIYVLDLVGFWEVRLLKDAIIWLLTVAFVTTFRSTKEATDLGFFFLFLKDNLKILVIFEFVMNMYVFSFVIELFIVLLIVFLTMLLSVIDITPNYKNMNGNILKNFANFIISLLVLVVIFNSIRGFILEFESLIFWDLIKDIVLPMILSFMFVFYIYGFVVFVSYETLIMGINRLKTINKDIKPKLIIRVLIFCNINITRIRNFMHWSGIYKVFINNDQDISDLFKRYNEFKIRKNTHNQDVSNFS